jgi:hypothetical protein
MKPTGEHPKHERYPVHFKSIFSTDGVHIEEGLLLDLSLDGCRLRSATHVPSGIPLELQIRPDQHSSICVSATVVCWKEDSDFGLAFKELPELESSTLTRLLWSCTSEGRMIHEFCSLWWKHATQSLTSHLPSVDDRLTGRDYR